MRFYALCAAGEVDDHGDTPLCATPIAPGETRGGVLWNAAGDDEDVFTFVAVEQETFAVEIGGASGLSLALLDEDGQALAPAASRLARTPALGSTRGMMGGADLRRRLRPTRRHRKEER